MESDSKVLSMEINPKHRQTVADGVHHEPVPDIPNVDEIWSDPPQTSEDLKQMMEFLDDKESNDECFQKQDVSPHMTTIEQLRKEIQDTRTPLSYLEEFEHVVKRELLYIGSIPVEQLQKEEQKLKEECVTNQALQATEQQRRIENLVKLTEQAKERIYFELKRQQKIADQRDANLKSKEKTIYERLQKAFRQAENDLRHALEKRKAEVKSFYGHLTFADSQYGGSKGRRWRVEWSKTPQPIQIKLRCIRGIRDKAPPGRYVLMVSLYNRLGGHVLRWSKLSGQQWGGATLPVFHDGVYSSSELTLEQSVFTVLPPQWKVQPGMILTFELFLLRGSAVPVDRVVAWGCFPICDGQFRIVEGYYKLPLIRGHMDHRLTKHSTIEELIATDIDHWIANMYIQIIRLPRYLSGQKEYEVELQFTSGLLSYPDRILNAEKAADGEKAPVQDDGDQVSSNDALNILSVGGVKSIASGSLSSLAATTAKASTRNASGKTLHLIKASLNGTETSHKLEKGEEATDDNVSDEEDLLPVTGQPGISYKIHYKNPVEDYNAKRATMLIPKTPLLNRQVPRPNLTTVEELEMHTFSVQHPFSMKGRLQRVGHERAEYVGRMFLSEMGFSQWQTRDFWITILLLVLFWFVRMYVHYCGQWLFLQALRLPVSSFVFFPYTVNLNYQSDLMTTGEEIGVVVLGPVSNIVVQILLVLVSWLSQLVLGTFPLLFSKLILAFSVWAVCDPYVILIVDSILGRYVQSATNPIGDAFKLYWHFLDVEGSGIIGIPMTIFLYLVVTFVASVVLYLYFLKLHNNGRMLDVFFRLHDNEDSFFMPHDLELSNQELSFIVKKAEQWRGSDGERRKVTVYDYIWDEDPEEFDSSNQQEITTHISLHTLHLDGLRELYRHFLKLPDGSIVEIFGELGSAHLLPDVKTALLKRANNIENIFGSSLSLDRNITTTFASNSAISMTQKLQLPDDRRERPLTGDSVKTRETIRRYSTDSSSDNSSN